LADALNRDEDLNLGPQDRGGQDDGIDALHEFFDLGVEMAQVPV